MKPIEAPSYAGKQKLRGTGPVSKKSKKGDNVTKTFYVAEHSYTEYFSMELLNLIGFNTPKCRFVKADAHKKNYRMATKEVKGHIPIRALRTQEEGAQPLPNETKWKNLAKQTKKYRLNIKNQVIEQLDSANRRIAEYKISGNLFSTDIAARLACDKDLQPNGENIVLVRIGNRFKVHLIDKETDPFHLGKSCEEVESKVLTTGGEEKVCFLNDTLFKGTMPEQRLAVIAKLNKSLKPQQGHFKDIFLNSRVAQTLPQIQSDLPDHDAKFLDPNELCRLYQETATSVRDHYLAQLSGKKSTMAANPPSQVSTQQQPNEAHSVTQASDDKQQEEKLLQAFQVRENERMVIAKKVSQQLGLPDAFLPHILEDLRGPYYQEFFPQDPAAKYKMSTEGLKKLRDDLSQELFHDISGLRAIFEEHIAGYSPDATRAIAVLTIRELFQELDMRPDSKSSLQEPKSNTQRSEIAIVLGCLLTEREKAQKAHQNGYSIARGLWKPISALAKRIDATIDEFCILGAAERTACVEAYQSYVDSKPQAAQTLQRVQRAVSVFF